MKPSNLLSICGIAALCLMSIPGHAVCELESSQLAMYGDTYDVKESSSCNLGDLLVELDHVVAVETDLKINLPNLVISAIDYSETFVGGGMIEYALSVEVANVGAFEARTPQVAIVVNLMGEPGAESLDRQEVYLERVGTIAVGGSVQIPVTTIIVPPARNGHTIQVIAVADPASTKQPGGEIWESNEMDNDRVRDIRTYGF